MSTVLEIVDDALGAIGIAAPTTLTTSDDLGRQCNKLLTEVAEDMIKRASWPRITFEKTFTTVASDIQASLATLAPDRKRIVKGTVWNRTQRWEVLGPTDKVTWQRAKTGQTWLDSGRHWRIRGDDFLIFEQRTVGDLIAFEYVSKNWLQPASTTEASARISRIAANTDECLLEDSVIKLGLQAKWLQANGLNFLPTLQAYMAAVKVQEAEEGQTDRISLNPPTRTQLDPQYPYDVVVQV